jgi:hypothetical protein
MMVVKQIGANTSAPVEDKSMLNTRKNEGARWSRCARSGAVTLLIMLTVAVTAQAQPQTKPTGAPCDRACMTGIVDQLLKSMVAHNPDTLPLATLYRATENSHPVSLRFAVLWRTVTEAHGPNLLAIDVPAGQAYLMSQISEAGSLSVMWGRIKVVDRKITELEFLIDRSRGDDGFEFSAEELVNDFKPIMSPPAGRKKATREELLKIGKAIFGPNDVTLEASPNCHLDEVGAKVVDPGLDDVTNMVNPGFATGDGKAASSAAITMSKDLNTPMGCAWFPISPKDPKARIIVVDEDLGIVAASGIVAGKVYPYPLNGKMVSAFIPDAMKSAQDAQEQWMQRKLKAGKEILVSPAPAVGDSIQVMQIYDGKIQAMQINVHLNGPGLQSVWEQWEDTK